MKIVIDIPEYIIENVKETKCLSIFYTETLAKAIVNGTPLPKGHGRLKDIDKIIHDGITKGWCEWYDEMKYAPTIIEADTGDTE